MPERGWFSLLTELRRGVRPSPEPGVDLWPGVYRLLLACLVLSIATGIAQSQAFALMQSPGLGAVRYADTVKALKGAIEKAGAALVFEANHQNMMKMVAMLVAAATS